MTPPSTTVLYVEDDEQYSKLIVSYFENIAPSISVVCASSAAEALERFEERTPDCIISDYDMPGETGLDLLRQIRDRDEDIPFILFTGKGSEEIATEAIRAGVSDYIQKRTGSEQYELLANEVRNLVERWRYKRRVEQVHQAIEHVSEGFSLLDADGNFIYVNDRYAEVFGYEPDELIGTHWSGLYRPDDAVEMETEILAELTPGDRWEGMTVMQQRDGSFVRVDHTLAFTGERQLVCLVSNPSTAPEPATGTAIQGNEVTQLE